MSGMEKAKGTHSIKSASNSICMARWELPGAQAPPITAIKCSGGLKGCVCVCMCVCVCVCWVSVCE
jgi:hypothetical protein